LSSLLFFAQNQIKDFFFFDADFLFLTSIY